MPKFLTKNEILLAHEEQIKLYGGSTGIRDIGLLESALAMPQAVFAGQYLHSSIYEMAAAYLFHIVSNHPFLDGNKRMGTVAALTFLDINGLWFNDIDDIDDALESLVLSIAQGDADKSVAATFFREHCVKQ